MRSLSERRSWLFAIVWVVGFFYASFDCASAACFGQGQQIAQQAVDKFLGNPSQILTENPEGGTAMISALRDLVGSNPATLAAVIALLANANTAQKAAIGTALGQAAQACLKPDPAFATLIQQQVAATGDQPAIVAFAAVVGDRPVGAVGGGAGGGAVSGGANGGQTNPLSVIGSPSGSLQTFTSSSTPTTTATFSIGGFGAGSFSTTTTNIISSAATSVSP